MASPRLKIQGKTYKVPTLEDLSLDDILLLDAELQDRYHSSWLKVQEFAALPPEESEGHPMTTLMGGVTVWMVLRVSGKQEISMREALAIPATAVEEVLLDGPKDHQPKKRKSSTRKASVPATGDDLVSSATPPLSSLPTTSPTRSESE